MSFLFFECYKNLLNEEVKSQILQTLKDIKKSYDWSQFDKCVKKEDLNLESDKYDDIIVERDLSANIAKLSVDLYRDYDHYQQFLLEDNTVDKRYTDRLVAIGLECVNGHWKAIRRPDLQTVEKNIFIYCLYRRMCQEIIPSKTKCTFCEGTIDDGSNKCTCGATMREIQIQREKIRETIVKSSHEFKSSSDYELSDNNICTMETGGNVTKEVDEYYVRKDNVENIKEKTWECGNCGLFNEYTLVNCGACGRLYKDGKWTCGKCVAVNICVNVSCTVCFERNVNVKEEVGKVVVQPILKPCPIRNPNMILLPANSWQCSKCECVQTYEFLVCKACVKERDMDDLWACVKCSLVNKCVDKICSVCFEPNKHLIVKYCQLCQKNNVTDDQEHCNACQLNIEPYEDVEDEMESQQWQCNYPKCRQLNDPDREYCDNCALWKDNPTNRGDECKQITNGKVQKVWVCMKCENINVVKDYTCKNVKCKETRYVKMQCTKCKTKSNGGTATCKKCHMIL